MTALDHEDIARIDKAHHILPCETNQHRTPRNARMVHGCSHSFSYAPISAELLVQRDSVPESLEQSCRITPRTMPQHPQHCWIPAQSQPWRVRWTNWETWRKPGELSEFLGMLQCVKKNFSRGRAEGKSRGWAWLLFKWYQFDFHGIFTSFLKQKLCLSGCPEQPLLICRDWYHKVVIGLRHDWFGLSCLKLATSAKDIKSSLDSTAFTEFSLSSLVLSSERQPWCWWQLPGKTVPT